MDLKRLDWILAKAQESSTLTAWEDSFVSDMTNRREKIGDKIQISERQEDVLERISEKD